MNLMMIKIFLAIKVFYNYYVSDFVKLIETNNAKWNIFFKNGNSWHYTY